MRIRNVVAKQRSADTPVAQFHHGVRTAYKDFESAASFYSKNDPAKVRFLYVKHEAREGIFRRRSMTDDRMEQDFDTPYEKGVIAAYGIELLRGALAGGFSVTYPSYNSDAAIDGVRLLAHSGTLFTSKRVERLVDQIIDKYAKCRGLDQFRIEDFRSYLRRKLDEKESKHIQTVQ